LHEENVVNSAENDTKFWSVLAALVMQMIIF